MVASAQRAHRLPLQRGISTSLAASRRVFHTGRPARCVRFTAPVVRLCQLLLGQVLCPQCLRLLPESLELCPQGFCVPIR